MQRDSFTFFTLTDRNNNSENLSLLTSTYISILMSIQ
jgi:hypothetical protein